MGFLSTSGNQMPSGYHQGHHTRYIDTLQEPQEILRPAHPLSNYHLFVALLPWYPSGEMVLLGCMVLLKITRPLTWLLDVTYVRYASAVGDTSCGTILIMGMRHADSDT